MFTGSYIQTFSECRFSSPPRPPRPRRDGGGVEHSAGAFSFSVLTDCIFSFFFKPRFKIYATGLFKHTKRILSRQSQGQQKIFWDVSGTRSTGLTADSVKLQP